MLSGGPSFLGLSDEPTGSGTYLLEDEDEESHVGRSLLLLLLLVGLAVAGWHWRSDLLPLARRFSAWIANTQPTQAVNSNSAPATASPSEVGGEVPSSGPPPVMTTDTGGDKAAQPQSASPSPSPSQNAASSSQPPQPAQVAPSNQAPDNSQPAIPEAKTESGTAVEPAAEKTITPEPAAKVSKPETKPASSSTAADALEAEGERYLYGTGVPANCSRAQKALLAAAEQSSAKAESVLGTMYATGHCVSRDLPLAYRWFARALQQEPNNRRVEQDLRALWNQMNGDQRQIAMRHQQ